MKELQSEVTKLKSLIDEIKYLMEGLTRRTKVGEIKW